MLPLKRAKIKECHDNNCFMPKRKGFKTRRVRTKRGELPRPEDEVRYLQRKKEKYLRRAKKLTETGLEKKVYLQTKKIYCTRGLNAIGLSPNRMGDKSLRAQVHKLVQEWADRALTKSKMSTIYMQHTGEERLLTGLGNC